MTMIPDFVAMVERFNREIIGYPIPEVPTLLSEGRKDWAMQVLNEELTEFYLARTIEDEADALIDFMYFAAGRLVEMGVSPRPVFEEVHAANMRKERGTLSKRPGSKGYDAVKPEGWTAPDLAPYMKCGRDMLVKAMKLEPCSDCATSICDECAPLGKEWFAFDDGHTISLDPRPKILVLGYARHGKDTVSEILRDTYHLNFTSSSAFCAEHVVYPALAPIYGYACWEDCLEDKEAHRQEWFELISAYNTPDKTRLAREILLSYDVYCGMRSKEELDACLNRGLFDKIVWVDASKRKDPEPETSCTVTLGMADAVIDNNGTLEDLHQRVEYFMRTL